MKRKGICFLCFLMAIVSLYGCSSGKNDSSGETADSGGSYDAKAYDTYEEDGNETQSKRVNGEYEEDIAGGRREIKNVNLTAETTEFDKLIEKIESKTEQLKGYIEQSAFENLGNEENIGNRFAGMIIRIPHEQLKIFTDYVKEEGNITYKSENSQDVTLEYVDKESKAAALKAQEDRILELIKKAESIDELIKLETRLSDIRYEREYTESSLKELENQVTYSTVYLDVQEVGRVTENKKGTAGEEIQNKFLQSMDTVGAVMRGLFVGLVGNIIYIVVLAVTAGCITWIIKKHKKKKVKAEKQ